MTADETIDGNKTFAHPIATAEPTQANHTATKNYVDNSKSVQSVVVWNHWLGPDGTVNAGISYNGSTTASLKWTVSGSPTEVFRSKFVKTQGLDNVTVYAYGLGSGGTRVSVNIGGVTGTVYTNNATMSWNQTTINISSFTNNSIYDVTLTPNTTYGGSCGIAIP